MPEDIVPNWALARQTVLNFRILIDLDAYWFGRVAEICYTLRLETNSRKSPQNVGTAHFSGTSERV